MKSILDPSLIEKLSDSGWTVGDGDELSLTHEDGSVATKKAAMIIIRHCDPDSILVAADENPERARQRAFANACAANEMAKQHIKNAQDATNYEMENGNDSPGNAWQIAYDLVFNKAVSGAAREALAELNSPLDYYDPDTSYEEDVCAFADALKEKIEELRSAMEPGSQSRRILGRS